MTYIKWIKKCHQLAAIRKLMVATTTAFCTEMHCHLFLYTSLTVCTSLCITETGATLCKLFLFNHFFFMFPKQWLISQEHSFFLHKNLTKRLLCYFKLFVKFHQQNIAHLIQMNSTVISQNHVLVEESHKNISGIGWEFEMLEWNPETSTDVISFCHKNPASL